MPLKKVIAEIGRGVFSPLGNGKKGIQKHSLPYFQNTNGTFPNRHIYYEPPEEFEFDATSSLLPTTTGEVIVHRLPTSPDLKPTTPNKDEERPPPFETPPSEDTSSDPKDNKERAYTNEEFTSAILARTRESPTACPSPLLSPDVVIYADEEIDEDTMGDSGVVTATMVRDSLTVGHGNGQTVVEECDCERRCSNPKHTHDGIGVSPVMERRNKGVLGRLRNFASRTSYSTSDDGHSHSSDYEDIEEEKKVDARFCRDSRERNSTSSWAGRVRDLHRDVKKKISRLRNSKGTIHDEDIGEGIENADGLKPPTPTSSNRSSTSVGEDDHNSYLGAFIGRARALVDCTPSPYDRDGLAFRKGDIIDIIAKHKTGIWVGMAQGKVGHFKFINVEEMDEERKTKHRRKKINNEWNKKPETLEELLKQINLQEYMNVFFLNGYDELDTFKEIEKVDLDNLGITNPEHLSKLLRAVEMLQDPDPDAEDMDEESQTIQSPRDSGCYASNENLIQRDSSQRALSNGQFTVDLEDQDTSQSESGIHSREGQDSAVALNNLDVSAESSTKSTAIDDVAVVTDTNDYPFESNNFNILPTLDNTSPPKENIDVTLAKVLVPKTDHQDTGALNVSYILSHSGTKSSPGSPRKTRTKHSRNKSHSHRSKDFLCDFPFQTYSFAKNRELTPSNFPDRGGYVYGWASFSSKNEKNSRKNGHDYDDVMSDPATEAEDSPGRHVYKKVKQRKGSLQTLIHDTRPPSPSLIFKVNKKLVAEKIYLHEEPYTDKTGFCGIPPALVQRYAEELHHGIMEVADALDQIRITSLQQQGRRGVPNDFLSDSCVVPVIEPNYSNLQLWLTSLGLPMYMSNFLNSEITELHHVASLSIDDIAHMGIRDPYHQIYLESAIGALFMRFQRRPQTFPQGQSIS
ncbi:hypothetical protein JTE90_008020 [Oedothorax gibbosus]|uniref:SAM and SH3 domain-containing protein 3 n=1 Tax=Oedothorax gibbosus TaxID=931172 RepID=A0AAV6UVW9_9ARAC|nr:hypothetical protein JTE90_008020 [Oedothorax gibbosus]